MAELDIVVVCLGNVCRSPLAERLLRHRFDALLGDAAGAVSVASAGVTALVGRAMDPLAAAELRRLGGDPEDFVARQWRSEMGGADLLLTATRALRSRVLEEAPRALKRTFTIREFAALTGDRSDAADSAPSRAGHPADLVARAASWRGSTVIEDYDVPDPIGQPAPVHREVAELLDRDCDTIARALVAALLNDVRVN